MSQKRVLNNDWEAIRYFCCTWVTVQPGMQDFLEVLFKWTLLILF